MYPTEPDSEVISYSSFYNIPEDMILKEDLTLIDDLTNYIVNEYIDTLIKSNSKDQRLEAIESLYEWLDYNLHLGHIFTMNRLAINEQDIQIKRSIIELLKFIKNNRV